MYLLPQNTCVLECLKWTLMILVEVLKNLNHFFEGLVRQINSTIY